MPWNGYMVKELAKTKRVPISKLAEKIGVSRQAITTWINGQIPKGRHLVALCKILGVDPGYFFNESLADAVTIPLHRTKRKKGVTPAMEKAARELADEYLTLFKQAGDSGIVPVLRVEHRDKANAINMAQQIRKLAGLADDKPIHYHEVFKLLEKIGITAVFRDFPKELDSYAFYSKIYGHRVVFVNNRTNILDLIYPLLHEAIHAIRDEYNLVNEDAEENFCDMVANYIQFPEAYVKYVAEAIDGCTPGVAITKLKTFSRENGHALYGMVKMLQETGAWNETNIGGADANLRKQFPTVGEWLVSGHEVRCYIENYYSITPSFLKTVYAQISGASIRKFGEWLGLDTMVDAKEAIEEVKRLFTPQTI